MGKAEPEERNSSKDECAAGQDKSCTKKDDESGRAASTLLTKLGDALIPVLVSAGSLISFVAFAGGVILWTRFNAVQVPAEQAVDAVPRDELVAIGAVLLLLFGFFGALALIGALIVDRGGRPTPGMARALVVLLAIESAAVVVLVEGRKPGATVVDLLLLLVPLGLAFWVTFSHSLTALKDDLPSRGRERECCEGRLHRTRPKRLSLASRGRWLILAFMALAVLLAWCRTEQWWVAVALLAAAVVTAGVWRIAMLDNRRMVWFGVAVFLSVPLFGTVMTMARNIDEPKVQPVAIIRSTDGPSEAIQGIYVTETNDRVYFANVATEGCSDELKPDSGRLLWVPREEVVAMSIGPAQDVKSAGSAALEMAYVLTPAVETPAAGSFKLTTAEQRFAKAERALAREADGQRLENAGPAVRPNFGAGLSLDPELVAPGEEVTLAMSAPNENDEGEVGFGDKPRGRTLRLDGAPLAIIKEATYLRDQAEFVKTSSGKVLSLEKNDIYRSEGGEDGEPVLVGEPKAGEKGVRYLKLEEDSEALVTREGLSGYPEYVKVRVDGEKIEIDSEQRVTVDGEEKPMPLEPYVLRQAWNETEIRFRVPDNASSGVVTVECEQLAGQPLLRVAHAPKARLSVRMVAGSQRVVLDSGRSRDADGKKDKKGREAERLTRSWNIAGRHMGNRRKVSVDLRQRLAPYSARLTVTDEDGQSDSVRVRVLRLPRSFFDFNEDELRGRAAKRRLARVKERVLEAVREKAPATIGLHGHTDAVGGDEYNASLSLGRVEHLRRRVFQSRSEKVEREDLIPVVVRAFGESCPIDRSGGRSARNRRVEIFLLDQGARVATQKSCKAAHVERTSW